MRTDIKVTRDNLNDVMEFDHVIRVNADGTVTDDVPGVWAPSVCANPESSPESIRRPDIDAMSGQRWSLLNGYSGQYGYSGPIMHDSEFIGGRMADDILGEPGVYVAVVVSDMDAADEDETPDMGWAVAKLVEVPDRWPVKALTTAEDKAAAGDLVTCGECERSWDDSIVTGMTPAPAARCPFEPWH